MSFTFVSDSIFELLHPYQDSELMAESLRKFYTFYPMDLRGLHERDPFGWKMSRDLEQMPMESIFGAPVLPQLKTRVD